MVTCNKDGHIDRVDPVEYLALAESSDRPQSPPIAPNP